MKFTIGDTVKHYTGITGEVIGVIRYKSGVIEYFVDYGNRCAWSMESSFKKGEAWRECREHGHYEADCAPCKLKNQTVEECRRNCPLRNREVNK